MGRFSFTTTIVKASPERRHVFGWASIVEIDGKPVIDSEGDVIAPDELEKAAYGHVLNARMAGESHVRVGVGRLVESVVFTPEKIKAMTDSLATIGIPAVISIPAVAWWVGYRLDDDDVIAAVARGDLTSFSIGGTGTRTPA